MNDRRLSVWALAVAVILVVLIVAVSCIPHYG